MVAVYLHTAVQRIHYENPVLPIDEQSGGQLELSIVRAARAEVIQQSSLLIEYLHHSKLPIRELSRWYLYRWVSAGRNIPYNAADPLSVDRAYKQWKKLIPDGQLPPRPKPGEGKDQSR